MPAAKLFRLKSEYTAGAFEDNGKTLAQRRHARL